MIKLYNIMEDIAIGFEEHFKKLNIKLSKPTLKMLPTLITAMIDSESVVTADMAKVIKLDNFSNNTESFQKRICRFLNNEKIDIYKIYNEIITDVISKISSTRHDELIVTLDHMYTKNKYVTLMFTLRVDKQGIPIYFQTERTSSNCHQEIQKISRKKLFSEQVIFDSIDEVIKLLSPLHTPIVFLADRWFLNLKVLEHIKKQNHYFCFRAKAYSSVKFLIYDNKEKHEIYKHLSDLHSWKNHAIYYENLELRDMKFACNLSISENKDNNKEYWYIVSNIKPNLAIKKYAKRYGAIEMFFKSQKTNGFYLESTDTKNTHAFETLYDIACIAALWLNIIALDYIKNYSHIKEKLNIPFSKKTNTGKHKRILSTFKLGLTLFKNVYYSTIEYALKFNFRLYL